jgi:hypothetical protein
MCALSVLPPKRWKERNDAMSESDYIYIQTKRIVWMGKLLTASLFRRVA